MGDTDVYLRLPYTYDTYALARSRAHNAHVLMIHTSKCMSKDNIFNGFMLLRKGSSIR